MLDRFLERRGEEIQGGTLTDKGWIANLINSGTPVSSAGLTVTEWTAEGIPALYACQRAISETVGQIPLKLILEDGKIRLPDTQNDLYYLLHDLPNPEMSAFSLKEMTTRHLVGWGNGYLEVDRDASGAVRGLWPLLPWRMRVDRDVKNRKRWRYTAPNGQPFEWMFDPARPPIMHLMINSVDGLVGRSPVRVLMDAVGLTLAADRFGAEFYNRYASPGVALKFPGRLTPKAKQNLRESWDDLRGQWGNKHRTAVLSEGLSLEKYTCAPNEAQFLETRSFQIEEMARMLRVPLFVIQHMTKSTSWGSGIEQIMLGWLSTGLSPYLVQWQQAVTRDLLTFAQMKTRRAVWITTALVKTDLLTRVRAQDVRIRNGTLSPNEARADEDLNPRTDAFGDEFLVPTNNATPATLVPDPTPPANLAANEGVD